VLVSTQSASSQKFFNDDVEQWRCQSPIQLSPSLSADRLACRCRDGGTATMAALAEVL